MLGNPRQASGRVAGLAAAALLSAMFALLPATLAHAAVDPTEAVPKASAGLATAARPGAAGAAVEGGAGTATQAVGGTATSPGTTTQSLDGTATGAGTTAPDAGTASGRSAGGAAAAGGSAIPAARTTVEAGVRPATRALGDAVASTGKAADGTGTGVGSAALGDADAAVGGAAGALLHTTAAGEKIATAVSDGVASATATSPVQGIVAPVARTPQAPFLTDKLGAGAVRQPAGHSPTAFVPVGEAGAPPSAATAGATAAPILRAGAQAIGAQTQTLAALIAAQAGPGAATAPFGSLSANGTVSPVAPTGWPAAASVRASGGGSHTQAGSPEPDTGRTPGGSSPGGATPTGPSGSFFFIVAGLLLLAAPGARRRLRHASLPRLPAPFVLIPERPG